MTKLTVALFATAPKNKSVNSV